MQKLYWRGRRVTNAAGAKREKCLCKTLFGVFRQPCSAQFVEQVRLLPTSPLCSDLVVPAGGTHVVFVSGCVRALLATVFVARCVRWSYATDVLFEVLFGSSGD